MDSFKEIDAGSFRDPEGFVFKVGERVLRALRQSGWDSYKAFRQSGMAKNLEEEGWVVRSWEIERQVPTDIGPLPSDIVGVIEQERIPFISYPYEWSFDMLKGAALHHLDLFLLASDSGFVIKDSSAYNIQFQGGQPVFIDVLSFEPYREGMPWVGYTQFCQSFLFPLALKAFRGLDFHSLLRSHIDGIPVGPARVLLGIKGWMKRGMFKHVILQSVFQKSFEQETPKLATADSASRVNFSLKNICALILSVRHSVEKMTPSPKESTWSSYRENNSYSSEAHEKKRTFVVNHVSRIRPSSLWDLGCNTGEFSLLVAEHCSQVVAMDSDPESVNRLYLHCRNQRIKNVLPLVIDLANPSPSMGWDLAERKSIFERSGPECLLALALIHHLCLARNIPLVKVLQFFAKLEAKSVIIEFVPKTDPMARQILANREDVFPWYRQSVFEEIVNSMFTIKDRVKLEDQGRILYCLERLH